MVISCAADAVDPEARVGRGEWIGDGGSGSLVFVLRTELGFFGYPGNGILSHENKSGCSRTWFLE